MNVSGVEKSIDIGCFPSTDFSLKSFKNVFVLRALAPGSKCTYANQVVSGI